MKKNLLATFVLLALYTAKIIAQPTITATGMNPVIGESFSSKISSYVNPGSAGANQTWNLSSMTAGTTNTTNIVAPSSTPYASSFPNANVCWQSGNAPGYFKTSASAFQFYGSVSPTTSTILSYSNPEDFLRFPFTFNNAYADPFSATYVANGYTCYRTGTVSVTADGWGTLTTPAGTYSNILRIHFVETYQDSADLGGFPYVLNVSVNHYFWYKEGVHFSLANVYTQTASGSTAQGGSYLTSPVGVNEIDNILNSYSLYPNPVTNKLNLRISVSKDMDGELKLYNALGAVVKTENTKFETGENIISVETSELPAGIYFSEIKIRNDVQTKKFIITR